MLYFFILVPFLLYQNSLKVIFYYFLVSIGDILFHSILLQGILAFPFLQLYTWVPSRTQYFVSEFSSVFNCFRNTYLIAFAYLLVPLFFFDSLPAILEFGYYYYCISQLAHYISLKIICPSLLPCWISQLTVFEWWPFNIFLLLKCLLFLHSSSHYFLFFYSLQREH